MSQNTAGARTEDPFGVLLRRSVLPTLVAGALCAVGAGLWRGPAGGLSAALGAAIVVLFFGARLLVMRRAARTNPQMLLVIALAVYTGKVVLLGIAMLVLTQVAGVDTRTLGLTVLLTAVVWLAAEMRGFVRLRIPVFATGRDDTPPGASGSGG
ncbi:hypothetical protein NUM3379_11410 [Kineococcus sp. NUM-3379]